MKLLQIHLNFTRTLNPLHIVDKSQMLVGVSAISHCSWRGSQALSLFGWLTTGQANLTLLHKYRSKSRNATRYNSNSFSVSEWYEQSAGLHLKRRKKTWKRAGKTVEKTKKSLESSTLVKIRGKSHNYLSQVKFQINNSIVTLIRG